MSSEAENKLINEAIRHYLCSYYAGIVNVDDPELLEEMVKDGRNCE